MFGLTHQYSCFVRSGGCLLPSTFSNGYYYQNFYVHFCIDLAFMDLSLHMYLPVTFRMFMFHKHQRSHSCSMHIASSLVLVFGTSTRTGVVVLERVFFFCEAFWVNPHTLQDSRVSLSWLWGRYSRFLMLYGSLYCAKIAQQNFLIRHCHEVE